MLEKNSEELMLAECEAVITAGMKSFYEIGKALSVINVHQLYRHQGHNTFEEYCLKKWNFERAHAYRLMSSYNVVLELEQRSNTTDQQNGLSPMGDTLLPTSERQVRPLTKVKDSDTRARIWEQVVKEAEAADEPITAKRVEEVTKQFVPDTDERDPMKYRRVTYLNEFYNNKFEKALRGECEADYLRRIIKAHLDHPELLAPHM